MPKKYKPGPIRHQQAQGIPSKRRLLAQWFRPVLVDTPMPNPAPTISGQDALGKLLVSRARTKIQTTSGQKTGVQLFNASIVRTGFVPRQKRSKIGSHSGIIPELKIPVTATDFNTWYQSSRSAEKKAWLDAKDHWKQKGRETGKIRVASKLNETLDQQAHQRFAFNIGINSIVEIGKGPDHQPTHIVIMKRSRHVPEAPLHWDPPAGLIRAEETGSRRGKPRDPLSVINGRVAGEIGVDTKKLQLIGPGLKPTDQNVWFALHRIDQATNYNAYVIQRADISLKEAKANIRQKITAAKQKGDPWAAVDFRVIPRNPTAIREFLATHDKTWIPEALRLYSLQLKK